MSSAPLVPVLIVDDNPAKRLALQAILRPLGYSAVEATSGREALRCVMAQNFAVILMDVLMPDMDGFETAAAIRQREQSRMTPIIFITSHQKSDISKSDLYAEGAVDFIFAPVPPHELRSKVSVFANLFIQAEELAARAREVQASADQLRLLTDAAPVGIFQTDEQNRYVYTNPRWTEITGISAGEAEGRSWDTIIASDQRAGLAAEHAQGGAEPLEVNHRFKLQSAGADAPTLHVTSKAISDSDGGTAGWVGTLADVTTEVGAEEAMSNARDQATEATRLKSDFLANMSHEIRTPMNGVIGMTELLLETRLDDRQRDFALTVRSSGEALLTIIDDILDFSKVEARQLEIEEIEFDLRSTVEDVVGLLARSAQAKGLEMVAAIGAAVPARVCGDPGRVRQVLINLIGNAIKFTQAGEIVVRVTTDEISGEDTVVRFEISDTGDGMEPEKLALVFQPFVQADTSTSRKYGGTGLGLSICSQLVELMGGDCGVSSQPGEGSNFWFTISVRADASQATDASSSSGAGLSGVSVLIADENATQRGVLSEYLTAWDMSVESAGSGQAALATMRAAAARDEPFDVALVDRSMPAVNGLELQDAIAADPALTVRPVPMIELGREPPADPYLSKPVHLEDLRVCLRVAIGLDEPSAAQTVETEQLHSTPVEPATRRLLLAEDNLVNQKVAVAMLTGAGYEVDTVPNGAEAVKAIARRRYDAVLMDCQMPEMNGYEATAAIRDREDTGPQTPIIALTAGARPKDRVRCLVAGMDDYLAKPVSKDALLALIARYVGNAPTPATEHLDEDVLADLEKLDGEVLTDLKSVYFDQAAELLSEISGAIGRGEAISVGETAHKLRGSSCTVGAAKVSGIASELEVMARAGDLATADSLLDRLGTGLDEAREAFLSRVG
ncbi:MAG: response regulator [Actinobacteria bacterium]|nr:response regulator [Actinomycetota bacterium]